MDDINAQEILENEWSHFFDVSKLDDGPVQLTLEPSDEERKRLALRLGVIAVDMLKCDISLKQESGSNIVHVIGTMQADLTQKCVVTLEPVAAHVEDEFEAWYADSEAAVSLSKVKQEKASKGGNAEVKMLEEHDDPEPIINGKIDLGELVSQYFSLSINPYPHAEGVHYKVGDDTDFKAEESDVNNPFAVLKEWKGKVTRGEE